MRFFQGAKMKPMYDASPFAEAVRPAAHAGKLPPMPSEDQPFFDESLRASIRSIGRLIRSRRKVTPDSAISATAPSAPR
ncbi:MAG TPA: hypothetical protein VE871_03755 [Longimicrobium sp.]|nr:hypothetical protein [Longimicrobium sp.]